MVVVFDTFAGSGVGVACQALGLEEKGVEIMPAAIETRRLNGMQTIYEDVWTGLQDDIYVPYTIKWSSPPCQPFSVSGPGGGRKAMPELLSLIERRVYESPGSLRQHAEHMGDDRISLVLTPLAHVVRDNPTYVAFEQVPSVLAVWDAFKPEMQRLGYSVWTGILDSWDYEVAQTRRRAYLIARKDGKVAGPPPKRGTRLAIRDVLPNAEEGLVSNYSTSSEHGFHKPGSKKLRGYRTVDQPAFTVTSKITSCTWNPSGDTVSVEEAAVLQSYPNGFEFGGRKSDQRLQIGNAVPPKVAEAVLRLFVGEE